MRKSAQFLRVLALGLPGVIAITLLMDPPPDIPRIALAANPTVLLIVLGLLGVFMAKKAGYRSAILLGDAPHWSTARRFGAITIGIGILIALLDYLALGASFDTPMPSMSENLKALIIGLTYGGATEEILMRWGLMSALTLGLMKLTNRDLAVKIAVVLSAGLFAAGHLPVLLATTDEISSSMIARVLILSGALGIWFGRLYARHNLETAITAHAGFHVGVFLVKLVL